MTSPGPLVSGQPALLQTGSKVEIHLVSQLHSCSEGREREVRGKEIRTDLVLRSLRPSSIVALRALLRPAWASGVASEPSVGVAWFRAAAEPGAGSL